MRNRLKSVTGRLMVWAALLLFPQVNEASILEDLIEQLSDRERKGFFIEGNVGVGVLQSTGTSHPDIDRLSTTYGSLSSKIGYFFNSVLRCLFRLWRRCNTYRESGGGLLYRTKGISAVYLPRDSRLRRRDWWRLPDPPTRVCRWKPLVYASGCMVF